MDKTMKIEDVGAPKSGARTSPIAREDDDEFEVVNQEVPDEPVCWFNDKTFEQGAMVYSGNDILRCDTGVWHRCGSRKG